MARKVNLNDGDFKRFKRNQASLGTQTPLSSTAVERGSTRWLDGSVVFIEGLLDVTGTLNASGQINLSGSTGITGPLNVTGTTTLDGDTEIGGLLDITGKTTIRNDLELLSGGLFKAGVTKIEPTGKAEFGSFIIDPASNKLIQAPGGWMFSDGVDHLGLSSSETSSVQLASTYAELNYDGASVVRAEAGLIKLNAPRTIVNGELVVTSEVILQSAILRFTGLLPETANKPNLHISSNGRLYKSTAVT